jgi:proteic killer suppression protein
VIRSFGNREAERIWFRRRPRRLPAKLYRTAERRLKMLHAAASLQDLLIPPGNRLEKLRGARRGQYSIRIDRQWRICFVWHRQHAHEVEIVDYHP